MNKLELIPALKNATDMTKPQAAAAVDILFSEMVIANTMWKISWAWFIYMVYIGSIKKKPY